MKAENLKFTNSEMLDHLYVYVSLVPRPSHIFNVTRRKGGGPGTQSHMQRVMMIDRDVA